LVSLHRIRLGIAARVERLAPDNFAGKSTKS
jgi:hypothetical protein